MGMEGDRERGARKSNGGGGVIGGERLGGLVDRGDGCRERVNDETIFRVLKTNTVKYECKKLSSSFCRTA